MTQEQKDQLRLHLQRILSGSSSTDEVRSNVFQALAILNAVKVIL